MTIKWVKVDPLVMNGEPFCYGSRLTVRQVLELRRNGYTVVDLLKDHPELRLVGIAEAYAYAGATATGTRTSSRPTARSPGPGCTDAEAAALPGAPAGPGRRGQAGGRPRLTRPARARRYALAASAAAEACGPVTRTSADSSSPPGVADQVRVVDLQVAGRERRADRAVLGARQLDRPARPPPDRSPSPSTTWTMSNRVKLCGWPSTWCPLTRTS